MNYPRVSIIVINWNRWRVAIRCLESVYQIIYPNYDVILIDNGSQDDSVARIKEWAQGKIPVEGKFLKYNPDGKPIRCIEYQRGEAGAGGGREEEISSLPSNKRLILIKNEQNLGGTIAYNIAMRYALDVLDTDYVCLLHNDNIVSPAFLGELINVANKEPGAGILGAKVPYYDEPNKLWSAGGMINYWRGAVLDRTQLGAFSEEKDAVEVAWVGACGMLISREVCQTVGLLDEDFLFGFDEADLCIRATKQGFKVLFVPEAVVQHDYESKPNLETYYSVKNRLILMQKQWSKLQLASAIFFNIVSLTKYLLHCLLRRRDWNYLRIYLQACWDYWKERKSYSRKKTSEREPRRA